MPVPSLELYEQRSLFCSFTSFSKNVTPGRTSACRANNDNDILLLVEGVFVQLFLGLTPTPALHVSHVMGLGTVHGLTQHWLIQEGTIG